MEFIKTIHSYWSYLVLIILVLAVVNAIIGLTSKKEFGNKDLRLGLFTLIFSHIQLLIGLLLYFGNGYASQISGDAMGNSDLRFVIIEHPLTMILAIVLITVGWSKHKKKEDSQAKFKTFAVLYGIALALVLLRIPWHIWPAA
jgi:heme/copper-type cytochrome/quinol oxidase subunit 3